MNTKGIKDKDESDLRCPCNTQGIIFYLDLCWSAFFQQQKFDG